MMAISKKVGCALLATGAVGLAALAVVVAVAWTLTTHADRAGDSSDAKAPGSSVSMPPETGLATYEKAASTVLKALTRTRDDLSALGDAPPDPDEARRWNEAMLELRKRAPQREREMKGAFAEYERIECPSEHQHLDSLLRDAYELYFRSQEIMKATLKGDRRDGALAAATYKRSMNLADQCLSHLAGAHERRRGEAARRDSVVEMMKHVASLSEQEHFGSIAGDTVEDRRDLWNQQLRFSRDGDRTVITSSHRHK